MRKGLSPLPAKFYLHFIPKKMVASVLFAADARHPEIVGAMLSTRQAKDGTAGM